MNRKDIREEIRRRRLYFDGGTGSILQARGLKPGELPETWNLTHPEEIVALHAGYLEAGSDIINANTFGANRLKYPDNLEEIVTAAVEHAKEARRRTGREDAYITIDMGPTGKLLEPMGDLPFEKAVELYGEVARLGEQAGADLVLIETMSDSYETKAAVLGAKENTTLPVFVTMVFDEHGKMLTGGTPESMVAMLEGLGVDALGVNCSLGPKQMIPIIARLLAVSSVPVVANPNAGLPRSENGVTSYDIDAEQFSNYMRQIAALGIAGAGGCCGTGPDHIRMTIARCRDIPLKTPEKKDRAVISSFSRAVVIGEKPLLIGERINPSIGKKMRASLEKGDLDVLLAEGLRQEDSDAAILDVNVGVPDIDEPAILTGLVKKLQATCALPLCLDTSDPAAMERAMRIYNGKPLLNSVTGEQEKMDRLFPLVKKYGGVVIGLLLDENGIPETADGRIAIAKKIYDTAASYGIEKKDIVLDPLALTISTGGQNGLVTLETIRRIRDELGGHSVLGVSNVSFGLPSRDYLNAQFLSLAMLNGLSLGIVNVLDRNIRLAYHTFLALTDQDPNCLSYIDLAQSLPQQVDGTPQTGSTGKEASADTAAGSGSKSDSAKKTNDLTLAACIERGIEQMAAEKTREALADGTAPMDLINEVLIPALDEVGKGFEDGSIFLPQLLMSAEAAKAAFAVVNETMADLPQEQKEKVILATVKGDIHDIGKNIVKVLLENYGYQVIDLGKDVDPQVIVDAAIKDDIKVVGLSALMTTTVGSMEDTIRLLREQKEDALVVVGGAVLNEEYAGRIGADQYAKDAMATVHFADKVFEAIRR
ncbi:MAG: homocysteine S-methyltransferase family protein [Firmicutes bacterium]|nr:homocysteine S-methyltransferase family protein [Bacillota bacterium]